MLFALSEGNRRGHLERRGFIFRDAPFFHAEETAEAFRDIVAFESNRHSLKNPPREVQQRLR